jgi:hypothetical protein
MPVVKIATSRLNGSTCRSPSQCTPSELTYGAEELSRFALGLIAVHAPLAPALVLRQIRSAGL